MRRSFGLPGCLLLLSSAATGSSAPEQLYFAQFGGGGGLRSDLVLTNPSPHSRVSGRVEFFAEDGAPLEVRLGSVPEPTSGVEYSIGPLGSVTLSALPEGELKAGAAVATGDGSLNGVIRFQIPGIGVAGVGVSRPSAAFIMPARLVAGGIGTGVAVHNATAGPVDLSLNLRDGKGKLLASSEIEGFPGRGHLARYVEQLFPEVELDEFEGTLAVEVKGGSVAATAVELGLQPGQLTTLPVTDLQWGGQKEETRLYFSQFGNGEGLSSAIVLVNPYRTVEVAGRVHLLGSDGGPLLVELAGEPVGTNEFVVAPLGEVTLLTSGAGDLQEGSARVESDGILGGVIRYEVSGIGTTAVPESAPVMGCLVPVRKTMTGINAGIAIQNASQGSMDLDLSLRDNSGKQPPGGQARIENLAVGGHLAQFVDELFPEADTEDFVGTIAVESRDGTFTASSVELGRQAGQFTTLPITPLQGRIQLADTVGVFNVVTDYVVLSLDNASEGARRRFYFGYSNPSSSLDSPVAGDFDGDGKDTLGFFNYREGRFYLANSNLPGVFDEVLSFLPEGHQPLADNRGWIPIAGDWTGEGVDRPAVYGWHNSTFHFFPDEEGNPQLSVPFSDPRPYPLAGDWDGDGVDGIGVCYLGENGGPNLYQLKNEVSEGPPDLVFEFGPVHGFPVAGDWNGDGVDTIGLFDSITKTFYLKNSNEDGLPDRTIVLEKGELFECLVCNRLPPNTIPGVFPVVGKWGTQGSAAEQTGYAWPMDRPENQGLDPAKLELALEEAQGLDHLRSLLVVLNGALVMEEYFDGYNATLTQNVKSVSKSVLSALYGIAYDKGLLPKTKAGPLEDLRNTRLNQFLTEYSVLPEVTLYHLMTMSAGLDVLADLPGEFVVADNWVEWTVHRGRSQQFPLGTFFYSTCLTHVGSEILTRATGMPTLDFARKELFEPLGISVTRWDHEPNPTDTYDGGWEMFMRPRDLARFGQLFLNKGRLEDGTQLISEEWVEASTGPLMPNGYALWWWTGGSNNRQQPKTWYPAYYANGLGGQRIFVFPTLDMVVVMTSLIPSPDPFGQAGANHQFLSAVVDAVMD